MKRLGDSFLGRALITTVILGLMVIAAVCCYWLFVLARFIGDRYPSLVEFIQDPWVFTALVGWFFIYIGVSSDAERRRDYPWRTDDTFTTGCNRQVDHGEE